MSGAIVKQYSEAHVAELKNSTRSSTEALSHALMKVKRGMQKVHPLLPGISVMVASSVAGYVLVQHSFGIAGATGSGFLFNVGAVDFSTVAKAQPQAIVQYAGQALSKLFLGY